MNLVTDQLPILNLHATRVSSLYELHQYHPPSPSVCIEQEEYVTNLEVKAWSWWIDLTTNKDIDIYKAPLRPSHNQTAKATI